MAIIPGRQKADLAFIDPQARKQKRLLYLLVSIIIAAAGIYFIYSRQPGILFPSPPASSVSSDPNSAANTKIIELLKLINLNISLQEDKRFNALILPGNLPVVVGEKGRQNPFAPF